MKAFLDNKAPEVIREATNMRTKKKIRKNINRRRKEVKLEREVNPGKIVINIF